MSERSKKLTCALDRRENKAYPIANYTVEDETRDAEKGQGGNKLKVSVLFVLLSFAFKRIAYTPSGLHLDQLAQDDTSKTRWLLLRSGQRSAAGIERQSWCRSFLPSSQQLTAPDTRLSTFSTSLTDI